MSSATPIPSNPPVLSTSSSITSSSSSSSFSPSSSSSSSPPSSSLNLFSTFNIGLCCYNCEWSPFNESLLCVSSAQNFGVIGPGRQDILSVNKSIGGVKLLKSFETSDGVYDSCWSEKSNNQVAFAVGDGSVKLWDFENNKILKDWKEHTAEVYSVDWNLINKENIISGSWDNKIKLWHPEENKSIRTFAEHNKSIYSTIWHPKNPSLFISCSGDQKIKMWDLNDNKSVLSINAHDYEVLTCDYNKYNEYLIVSGSVDKSIRGWDIRNTKQPVFLLEGHEFAVRRIKCSPHNPNVIGSVSYDMSCIIWDFSLENSIIQKFEDPTEFVLGIDFNLFSQNFIAISSWDENVYFYKIKQS